MVHITEDKSQQKGWDLQHVLDSRADPPHLPHGCLLTTVLPCRHDTVLGAAYAQC